MFFQPGGSRANQAKQIKKTKHNQHLQIITKRPLNSPNYFQHNYIILVHSLCRQLELITEENGASESCIRLTKQFEVHILIIFRISFFEVNGVINLSYTN